MVHSLTALSIDLHVHLEHDEYVEPLAQAISGRLHAVAVTNHGHKPDVMAHQPARIDALRSLRPDLLVLPGVEWDALGAHINLVFPDERAFAAEAYGFLDSFNGVQSPERMHAALDALAAMPPESRPVLIVNHPAHGADGARSIVQALASRPSIAAGVDVFHGHQGWQQAFPDPLEYPGNTPGGICDVLPASGRPAAATAGSDFHIHKNAERPDFAPGRFQFTVVTCSSCTGPGIIEGLAHGRSVAVQGGIVDGLEVHWQDDALRVRFTAAAPLARWDVVGRKQRGDPVHVLRTFGRAAGEVDEVLEAPPAHGAYVRVRGASVSRERPAPGGSYPSAFASGAFFPDGAPC